MSDHFEARKDSAVQRQAMRAYVGVLLDNVLEPMQLAARGCGYALAVHGSKARDIDIVAIPWTVSASEPELLVARLAGVIAGTLGRAYPSKEWADKPHGRKAVTIITTGDAEFDISIMPLLPSPPTPVREE